MCLSRPSVRSEAKPSSGGTHMFNPSMGEGGEGADLSSKPAYSTTYSTNDCKGYTEKPCWGWRDGGWGVGLEKYINTCAISSAS